RIRGGTPRAGAETVGHPSGQQCHCRTGGRPMSAAPRADRPLVSVLFCQECSREQPHQVRLGPEGVVETVCTACGRVVSLPQRRSAPVVLGPYVLGGGAPVLVSARVPAG